ncbi:MULTISPECIES: hypothetical protein [Aeromonas]|nr:hypothetical protein [Aeromonas dhakensis]
MDFSIAGEGVTDQVTIQNVLCGFFDTIEDLEQEVIFVQPHQDATDEEDVRGYGSWTSLFSYLKDKRFRDDVVNTSFLIIQVDSDVCEEIGFDVKRSASSNSEELVSAIVTRLICQINSGSDGFYDKYKENIIFAVCVDSIECWLYKYYENDKQKVKNDKTLNCAASLETVIFRFHKKLSTKKCAKEYDKLSKPFRKRKTLQMISDVDSSLKIFLNNLETISYP